MPLVHQSLTDEDLDLLRRKVDELRATPKEKIKRVNGLAFHRKLFLISRNSLIIRLNEILSNLLRKTMEDVAVALGTQTGRMCHRMILETLLAGDHTKPEPKH